MIHAARRARWNAWVVDVGCQTERDPAEEQHFGRDMGLRLQRPPAAPAKRLTFATDLVAQMRLRLAKFWRIPRIIDGADASSI